MATVHSWTRCKHGKQGLLQEVDSTQRKLWRTSLLTGQRWSIRTVGRLQ
jgi:hypothetical protein